MCGEKGKKKINRRKRRMNKYFVKCNSMENIFSISQINRGKYYHFSCLLYNKSFCLLNEGNSDVLSD